MKIGLISDTHGFFDPKVRGIFAGVDHILHAGDIGYESIILALEEIAPVTAVLGNTDAGLDYRETEVVRLGSWTFLVRHIVDPRSPGSSLEGQIRRAEPNAIIFGHTHRSYAGQVGSRWFINPGYAGKPRFDLPRSVAILTCHEAGLVVDPISL